MEHLVGNQSRIWPSDLSGSYGVMYIEATSPEINQSTFAHSEFLEVFKNLTNLSSFLSSTWTIRASRAFKIKFLSWILLQEGKNFFRDLSQCPLSDRGGNYWKSFSLPWFSLGGLDHQSDLSGIRQRVWRTSEQKGSAGEHSHLSLISLGNQVKNVLMEAGTKVGAVSGSVASGFWYAVGVCPG